MAPGAGAPSPALPLPLADVACYTVRMLSKRSFTIQGHRTSIALEPAFWVEFDRAVAADGVTPTAWVTLLDEARRQTGIDFGDCERLD